MIHLPAVTIHEPDVALTDLALAMLGAYFAWRLWTGREGFLSRAGGVLMAGLASAAFWGAIFHAFFPEETATTSGFIAWVPVALSILVAAATMLELALRLLWPRLRPAPRRVLLGIYASGFVLVVLLVDESFTSIVRFYAPALLLLLAGARLHAVRSRSAGWSSISTGLVISAGAALLQQAGVSIHPDYFDHNAVYHVLQGIGLVFLYLGFRAVPEGGGSAFAAGADPATREG